MFAHCCNRIANLEYNRGKFMDSIQFSYKAIETYNKNENFNYKLKVDSLILICNCGLNVKMNKMVIKSLAIYTNALTFYIVPLKY